ncbi:MAG TPA: VWA domain-containing protein [Bryobacteraceae bacterium]|nr:VWA domain-containing protein [Bryobacteraceae bacterium]
MGFRRSTTLAVHSLALTASLWAWQSKDTDPVFRVDVRLVRLLATVKDNHGRPVAGLTEKDFSIRDNGVAQSISLFERQTAQPLSVAVLLDVSGSAAKEMKYQTDAVHRFVKALFGEGNPEDRAALFAFNWQVERTVGFTRNTTRFIEGMKRLKPEAGTSMYDAILLASEELEEREGRHVLVVVTDGADTVSGTNYAAALRAAHKADAVVYPILSVPITNEAGRNVGGENALTTIAHSTGGRLFAPGTNGLDQAFADILRDLRTQYLIGYYPRGVPRTKEPYHRVEVQMQNPALHVITRSGYYEDTSR